MRTAVVVVLLGMSCEPPVDRNTFTNDGEVCIDAAAGEAVVHVNTCLSSSCDTLVSSSCSVTLEGTTLTVTSEAVVDSQGDVCTDDCGFVLIRCDLPDGDLTGTTVQHGTFSGAYDDLVGACDAF